MILQSLVKYYDRLAKEPNVDIPQFGYSKEQISFSIVLSDEGELLQIKDLKEKPEKGKAKPVLLTVPKKEDKKGEKIVPFFTWDNSGYILGKGNIDYKKKKSEEEQLERYKKQLISFSNKIKKGITYNSDKGLIAINKFLDNWSLGESDSIDNIEDILNDTGNIVFELDSEIGYIHNRPAVKKVWSSMIENDSDNVNKEICLVNGDMSLIARIHPVIKGVNGGQACQSITSFNFDSVLSFNKKQNFNSPVGVNAAFAYTTALNYLLDGKNNQRISIGDTSTVFWTEKKNTIEQLFGPLLDQKDDGSNEEIKLFLDALKNGKMPTDIETDVPFYILGLAPNAARISIRFWNVSTVGDMANNLIQHFKDMEIITKDKYKSPSMKNILRRTAVLRKDDNVSSLLSGNFFRAIITGGVYPETLLSALIARIKSEKENPKKGIYKLDYIRAGMLKAILNRRNRIKNNNNNKKEVVTMALNKENKEIPYLLGRLFAVLEKVQKDAHKQANSSKELNTTIKDRYFSTASASPKIVFPELIKTSQHHISKIQAKNIGQGINFDKEIMEIIDMLPDEKFKKNLKLDEQGLFFIGYYRILFKYSCNSFCR